ncbi:hypothetical protein N180_03420 [Pedobacter antarcticus 4BY]|uniref:Outer membrane protein beta-barrel domain-containing protein n=2 Tax=Pedobacter antarcticus TaxID=34086 RepID=A0A081PKT4_9SPHI|nr:hypothetical protein [Pedobacter antarcticus]KEQ31307.1 hypothetical protein N180_03420 [Pedobacter antarcticus 4BY]SFE58085.1 hypothetical protein SAMN03003324_00970 [Pedobacter antarcticus]
MRYLYFFLLLFQWQQTKSQTIWSGSIIAAPDMKGVAGIQITVRTKTADSILTYSRTETSGAYRVQFTSAADTLGIFISGIGMENKVIYLANHSQKVNITLSPNAIQLKELKVKPPRISRIKDTLNYLVDEFTDQNDRTIGDVLKKMPGIEVKENGSILYNNKPINKFYIEQKDLLQGRYGIATNNITAADVATVQVMENHQPVKALTNSEFTNEAAINIKLKDAAKGVVVANAQLGIGIKPFLWDNELFGMFFKSGRQMINTYKGNNTGQDPGAEFRHLYTGNQNQQDLKLSIQEPGDPPVNQNRYLFNRAHAISVNNLWAFENDKQLNLNLNYLKDVQQRNSLANTGYYLTQEQLLEISEKLSSTRRINQFEGALKYNINSKKYYLNQELSFLGNWGTSKGIAVQRDSVIQDLSQPNYVLENRFDLVKQYGTGLFKLSSVTRLERSTQELIVSPVSFPLLSAHSGSGIWNQDLTDQQWSTKNKMSFGWNQNKFKHNYTAGIELKERLIYSDLQENNRSFVSGDSLKNQLKWNAAEVYFNPDFIFLTGKFRFNFSVPVKIASLQIREKYNHLDQVKNRLFINPSIYLNYEVNPMMNLNLNLYRKSTLGEADQIIPGIIMQNYRMLMRSSSELQEIELKGISAGWNYNNPVKSLFINISNTANWKMSNLIYSYAFNGGFQVLTAYMLPNQSFSNRLSTRISKGIDAIKGTFTMEAGYSADKGEQISQEEFYKSIYETISFKPAFSTRFRPWISVAGSLLFSSSSNKVYGIPDIFKPVRMQLQSSRLNFFPSKKLTIYVSHERYYVQNIYTGSKTVHFANTGMQYRFKSIDFNMDYTNLFNTKDYVTANYDAIGYRIVGYLLRPAQLMLKVKFNLRGKTRNNE